MDPEPLTAKEIELYREGLRDAPTFPLEPPRDIDKTTLMEITIGEWADRCRRLLATLDAALAANPAPAGLDESAGSPPKSVGAIEDPAPAGLDVERLGAAINKARHGGPCGHGGLTCDELAERVAHEYET